MTNENLSYDNPQLYQFDSFLGFGKFAKGIAKKVKQGAQKRKAKRSAKKQNSNTQAQTQSSNSGGGILAGLAGALTAATGIRVSAPTPETSTAENPKELEGVVVKNTRNSEREDITATEQKKPNYILYIGIGLALLLVVFIILKKYKK